MTYLKASPTAYFIDDPKWKTDACDRYKWWHAIHQCNMIFQEHCNNLSKCQVSKGEIIDPAIHQRTCDEDDRVCLSNKETAQLSPIRWTPHPTKIAEQALQNKPGAVQNNLVYYIYNKLC